MHEAEVGGALAEPFFVGGAGAVPDDAGVFDVEFFGEAVNAEEPEVWDVVDIGHDEHSGDIAQFAAVLGLDAVGVKVVEEGFYYGVGLGDVHLLGVELSHLGGIKTSEMWPASLENKLMDVDRR